MVRMSKLTGEEEATDRLAVKVMVLVPLLPSATVTSSIVSDGVGAASSFPSQTLAWPSVTVAPTTLVTLT